MTTTARADQTAPSPDGYYEILAIEHPGRATDNVHTRAAELVLQERYVGRTLRRGTLEAYGFRLRTETVADLTQAGIVWDVVLRPAAVPRAG